MIFPLKHHQVPVLYLFPPQMAHLTLCLVSVKDICITAPLGIQESLKFLLSSLSLFWYADVKTLFSTLVKVYHGFCVEPKSWRSIFSSLVSDINYKLYIRILITAVKSRQKIPVAGNSGTTGAFVYGYVWLKGCGSVSICSVHWIQLLCSFC